jgi:hypothetical protein
MVKKLILILLFCSTASADAILPKSYSYADLIIPHQAFWQTEIYSYYSPLSTDISVRDNIEYKQEDQIFWVPAEYCGIGELYSVGFYEDMHLNISSDFQGNEWRIFYFYPSFSFNKNEILLTQIPEPMTTILFLAGLLVFSGGAARHDRWRRKQI